MSASRVTTYHLLFAVELALNHIEAGTKIGLIDLHVAEGLLQDYIADAIVDTGLRQRAEALLQQIIKP